ncbi:DUF2795 domain-containing protein [Allorhizocola rhizosphaerae]|uniref:DUF2795 domain-containing protein n=1 Tax=Allorhizocola rhizosphaerae TaxID=1872709 RepID=UPI000E3E5741|nr:DUF2795 domain-containing protein [Allorhizocola rhizosphaerae]
MNDQTAWAQVQEALSDLDFPATKEEVVEHASRHAGEAGRKLLRALPLATYRNMSEIRSSVPLDPAADDGQTAAQKAEQARSKHDHRIAEHLRRPD